FVLFVTFCSTSSPSARLLAMTLADLFPDEDYHFGMRFERANAAEFFAVTAQHQVLLAERGKWLESAPGDYLAALPEALPLVNAAIQFGRENQSLPPSIMIPGPSDDLIASVLELGLAWEPDFLLLKPDSTGCMRLVAGCVCCPSSWSLAEKIGRP